MPAQRDRSSMTEHPFPTEDDGLIPIRSLHVSRCDVRHVQRFIEDNHYSHSIFGCTVSACFRVTHEHDVVGAAIFGLPAGVGVKEKYSDGRPLLELRRFCLADACPRNSESYTLAIMLRELCRDGIGCVLSYADPAHGHEGIIYKALGFEYRGKTAARKHIMWKGKKYPDRNVHQTNFPFHKELRAALDEGAAKKVPVPGKHIFVKYL